MAIAVKEGGMTIENVREVLNDSFKSLIFDNLKSVKFVGDGTYFEFSDKFIEIRPSGTDAKTKAYGGGLNKDDIQKYATILGNYSGERTQLHKELISEELYKNCKKLAMEYYLAFVDKDANNEPFEIPQYSF
jgi:hypothetical protein